MIEPVYVEVQKIAGSVVVPTKHLDPERRKFSHILIVFQLEELVGSPVEVWNFEEIESPFYIPPTLAWWEKVLRAFGREYPDRVEMVTRIVGFAYGCRHPFTDKWIEVDPKGPRSIAFLPPMGVRDARNRP